MAADAALAPDAGRSDANAPDSAGNDVGTADAATPPDAGGDGGLVAATSIAATAGCSGSAWALGTLRRVPVGDLGTTQLTADDVVWTDGIPATLPSAGAVIVGSGKIPDALYAAAANRLIPLIEWPATDDRLGPLVGRELAVVTTILGLTGTYHCEVHFDDITGLLSPPERAEIVAARSSPATTPARALVLPRPTAFCAVGQEGTTAFAIHRNKPRVLLTPKHTYVSHPVGASIEDRIEITHRVSDQDVLESGSMGSLPGAAFHTDGYSLTDEWSSQDQVGLSFGIELPIYGVESCLTAGAMPLVLFDHLTATFVVTYPTPISDPTGATSTERVELWPCSGIDAGGQASRSIDVLGRGHVNYDLLVGGLPSLTYFTYPLDRVLHSELSGLFAETIVLSADVAQSAAPDHHNFSESLILEPSRDPSVPANVLQTLETANVKAIYLKVDLMLANPNTVTEGFVQGLDGTWRPL